MKIRLNDLTMIMSFETDSEKKLIKKFITFKDDKGAFFGGKFHPERVKDVCLGKEIREYFEYDFRSSHSLKAIFFGFIFNVYLCICILHTSYPPLLI